MIGSADGLIAGQEYSMSLSRLGRVVRLGGIVGNGTDDPMKSLPPDTVALIDTGDNFPEYRGKLPVLDARRKGNDFLAKLKALRVVSDDLIDLESGRLDGANGQIFSNTRKQTFNVLTPECEAFILPSGEAFSPRSPATAGRWRSPGGFSFST